MILRFHQSLPDIDAFKGSKIKYKLQFLNPPLQVSK